MVNNRRPPLAPSSSPIQRKVYYNVKRGIQGDVKRINNNCNSLSHTNAQMFNSPGVSVELAESVMARATQKWLQSNMRKEDGGQGSNLTTTRGNKRKKSWDELVAEEYDKEQPTILANQLECLNMRSEKKNKKVMKEKQDVFKMYMNNKSDAIRKLNLARAGESSSADHDDEEDNQN